MTVQTTQDTGRSVRLETMKAPSTQLLELVAIRGLIDSLLADKGISEEQEANLYSARHHVVRAIKEVA